MKKRSYKVLLLTMLIFIFSTSITFAEEVEVVVGNADKFGLWTLLPPLVAIILAFMTKNVVISLFIGILSGSFLVSLSGYNVFEAFIHAFLDFVNRALNSLADPWNAGIVLQVLAIGGIINLVAKMGGAKAIAEALAKKAKTVKSTQLTTWLLGLCVFFDDYANSLIVGPIMRPVADKMKMSRERLAFIIDATAAPVAGLAIISTWIGLEVSLIGDAFSSIGIDESGFGVFLKTIPYRFYNILILAFIVITALTLKEFGPMRKAEIAARNKSKNLSEEIAAESSSQMDELEPKEGIKLSIWNAIIPIGALIISALIAFYYSGYSTIMGGEPSTAQEIMMNSPFSFKGIMEAFAASDSSIALFQSALFASIVAIGMGVAKKIFTLSEAIEVWVDGMKGLIITGVILILAWSLGSVIKELGTAYYLVVSTSAVLTGAIFGDHCSPISDTTILSSMGAGCNHIEHVKTQIWYSVFVAIITILFGYIPAGFGVPVYVVLPLSLIALFIGVQLFGKKVEEA